MRVRCAVALAGLIATLACGTTALAQTFTDDPLTVGTPIKAVHVTELRTAVANLRAFVGLPVFPFTDPTITPTVTLIRAVHVEELRSALNEVYDAAAKPHPTYTDPTLAGVVIKAVHIQQLRAAVFNAINDAPSFTKGADQTVNEDAAAQTIVGWATNISAGPGESGQTVTFVIDSNDLPGLFSAGPAVSSNGTLTYTPAANQNGGAHITLHAHDDGGTGGGGVDTSATQAFTITVNAVNDAPSFTKGADETVLEDTGLHTVTTWATAISAGPSESGQTVTFNITGNTNTGLFSVLPAVASNGTLTYTLAANAFGAATITLTLSDDGGTANGGVNTSPSQSFTITVTAVNDVPSFTKGADQTVNEDAGAQSIVGWATAISAGPANEAAQVVDFVIDSNTNTGLFSAGPSVAANGTLTYTPAANQNGVATITLHIHDNGGTANGGSDASATQSFTITVNAVNDPPVVTNKTANAQANMRVSIPGLLGGVTDADTGVSGCTPTFTVASVSATTPVGGLVTITNAATGVVDFDPPPGATGAVTFTYTVSDTGCPGVATSAAATVTVTVAGPVIWFVDSTAPAGGNGIWTGTNAKAFQTIAAAAAVDASDHRVFVFNTNAGASINYAGGIALSPGEWLIGQAATNSPTNTFDALMGITPPPGTVARPSIGAAFRPTLQGTVTVNTQSAGNVVKLLGFNLSTGAATGLTNGGTTINGVTINLGSVTTTTGTAVSITGTNNGTTVANAMTLVSVAANGAANGIVLNNATGSFTITGDAGGSNNGSGGTIQNTTSHGISLSNVQNVSLDQVIIQTTADSGINGTQVANFSFTNGTINNSGNAGFESNIAFNTSPTTANNINGTLTVTGSTLTNAFYSGLDVQAADGTVTNATISNNTITSTASTSTSVGHGINFTGIGNASTVFNLNKATINGNVISNFPSANGIQINGGNASASGPGGTTGIPNDATNIISITNNNIHGLNSTTRMGGSAIIVAVQGANAASRGRANVNISNNGTVANPLTNIGGTVIGVGNNGFTTMTATVDSNVIVANHQANFGGANGIAGGNGISGAGNLWTPDLTWIVTNNTISQTDGNGILLVGRGTSGTARLKIANNTVGASINAGGTARQGIRVDAGNASSADDAVFLNIFGNSSAGSNGAAGIGVRKNGTVQTVNDFGLFDAAGGPTLANCPNPTTTDISNFINARNPAGNGTDIISGSAYECDTTQAPPRG